MMKLDQILLLLLSREVASFQAARLSTRTPILTSTLRLDSAVSSDSAENPSETEEEVDVVVIGAGIGGLSCAALSAKYGWKTVCLEAHDTPGGVAHSFDRYSVASKTTPFRFDSGPSLISGLSKKGTNPLRQVLDALETADEIEWKTYDGWVVHDTSDDTNFKITTGDSGAFETEIEKKAGSAARREFEDFRDAMLQRRGLSESSAYIPPFALRGDAKAVGSLARYTFKLLSMGTKGGLLTAPFSNILDQYNVKHPFVRQWFDYLSFALSGLDASQTQAAAVAYMMMDLHKPGALLDYPMGGMDALIQALVTGLEKNGGQLSVNQRVERILLETNENDSVRATGVQMSDGRIVRARQGVVCNAPLWNMARILQDSSVPDQSTAVTEAVHKVQQRADDMCMTRSFMHLHLGIPKDGLSDDLECHHSVLDLSEDVTAEQNMVIISIPTVFDPSLAPEGYHIVHAYSAACDDFDQWAPFLEEGKETGKVGESPNSGKAASYDKSPEYQRLKEEKSELLWKAIERVIPDVRKRAKRRGSVVLSASPLTHRRYNQRFRGTYGPAPSPGKDIWELAGAKTEIDGLLACGDTTFPGIGLPGVAASGTIAANTLTSLRSQNALLKELRKQGALQ